MTIYLCFLAGGAVLPFINFIFGALSDGFGGDVDTDVNLDVDSHTDLDLGIGSETHTEITSGSDVGTNTGMEIETGGNTMFSLGLVPTSLLALSALSIAFGAVGGLMSYSGKSAVITFVVAIIAGYIASVVVQTILKTLKNVQKRSYGIDENVLLLYDGKVIDTILPGQLGTVSFNTLENVMVSYPARCIDESMRLETGRIVKAIQLKNGIVIVEAKNKYE